MDSSYYGPLISKIPLFSELSEAETEHLLSIASEQNLEKGEYLFRERDKPDNLFILFEGSLEILKEAPGTHKLYHLNTIEPQVVIGEMGLLENEARSASVKANTNAKLLKISIPDLQLARKNKPYVSSIIYHLAQEISNRLRHMNDVTVIALERQVAMGHFFIFLVVSLCVFIFFLSWFTSLVKADVTTTYITLPVTMLLAAVILWYMKHSPFPMREFGFNLDNWRKVVSGTLLRVMPFILFMPIFKYLLSVTKHGSAPLFIESITPGWFIYVFLYLIISIVQEIIVRGAFQTSLEKYLVRHSKIHALLISNLLFSTIHLYLSFNLSVLTFFAGLFFGWLYIQYKTLLSPILAHFLMGFFGFFVFDFSDLLIDSG